MPLQLDNLRNSVRELAELAAASADEERMSRLDDTERRGIRDGVIQNFEITYELSWKLITRWLNANINPGIADGVTRRQIFRRAAEHRLIADVDTWMRHHAARNATSHTYDEDRAVQVYSATLDFVTDARLLLEALEARND